MCREPWTKDKGWTCLHFSFSSCKQCLRYPQLGKLFNNYFFPFFTKLWNNLPQKMRCFDIDLFKEKLHKKYKPLKIKFYFHGTKIGNSLLTRLRVDRSYLNCHAYSIGLAPSPQCACGAKQEITLHMVIFCLLFTSGCRNLIDLVGQLVSPFSKFNHREKTTLTLLSRVSPLTSFFEKTVRFVP